MSLMMLIFQWERQKMNKTRQISKLYLILEVKLLWGKKARRGTWSEGRECDV